MACAVSQELRCSLLNKVSNLPGINSLGSLSLKYVQQSLIMFVLEVRNNFVNNG